MVRRAAIQRPQMHISPRRLRESLKEILQQLSLKIAHAPRRNSRAADAVRAATQINRRSRKRFIHGHQKVSSAQNAALRSQRLQHRFAKHDAHILDGVMLIDIEIAARLQIEVKSPMARNEFKHVVEKTYTGADARFSAPVEIKAQADVRLGSLAMDAGLTLCGKHLAITSLFQSRG